MSSNPYYKSKHWRQSRARRLAIDCLIDFVKLDSEYETARHMNKFV